MPDDFEPSGVWRYRCREFGGWSEWITGTLTELQSKIYARSARHVEAYPLYRSVNYQKLTGDALSTAIARRLEKVNG